jgi:hypothetical protein
MSRLSPSKVVGVAAALLLALFFLAFSATHWLWYDCMSSEGKVHFWTDFAVAWGTTALAVVTWASVYETQQVLLGEDRRFRQSRIPVVTIAPNENGQYYTIHGNRFRLLLENVGDGPAIDVTLDMTLEVTYTAATTGGLGPTMPAQVVDPEKTELAVLREFRASSFLPTRHPQEWSHPLNVPKVVVHNGYQLQRQIVVKLDFLTIRFRDAFGEPHMVRYPDFTAAPRQFDREVPPTL